MRLAVERTMGLPEVLAPHNNRWWPRKIHSRNYNFVVVSGARCLRKSFVASFGVIYLPLVRVVRGWGHHPGSSHFPWVNLPKRLVFEIVDCINHSNKFVPISVVRDGVVAYIPDTNVRPRVVSHNTPRSRPPTRHKDTCRDKNKKSYRTNPPRSNGAILVDDCALHNERRGPVEYTSTRDAVSPGSNSRPCEKITLRDETKYQIIWAIPPRAFWKCYPVHWSIVNNGASHGVPRPPRQHKNPNSPVWGRRH
mmetsp:Transcript_17322/g.35897  ORF Transcript_17322/g.35897 Transcript_17322/m.35897 type:complete len:251 (-) Transcript_17322:594-1346(-)